MMRAIRMPGPPPPERIQWVEARGRAFTFEAEAGLPLLEAMRRGFADAGFSGGVANIDGGALGPFAYVMPALSKTGEHAAFYSEIFRPAGLTRLKSAAMTLGVRDGEPFFHCHALWSEADGRVSGGHILPDETVVAEPFVVRAFGIDGAQFTAEHDPETNFKLFGPVPAAPGTDTGRADSSPAAQPPLPSEPGTDLPSPPAGEGSRRRRVGEGDDVAANSEGAETHSPSPSRRFASPALSLQGRGQSVRMIALQKSTMVEGTGPATDEAACFPPDRSSGRVFALRLRPNQDFATALEGFCRQHGIERARLHGGVGSIIGARFEDGTAIEPFATELLVRSGSVAPNARGDLEAALDVALVDYTGGLAEGRLTRGDNPVLMTMEIALEAI